MTVSISRPKDKCIKPLTVSESILKIEIMSWKRENEIMQYHQNYICYDVNEDKFREPIQSSTNAIIND